MMKQQKPLWLAMLLTATLFAMGSALLAEQQQYQ
jgi:hypothetical protein